MEMLKKLSLIVHRGKNILCYVNIMKVSINILLNICTCTQIFYFLLHNQIWTFFKISICT